MNVAYLGPCFDYSGYGEANRHFIAALNASGVNVQVMPVSYVREQSDFGSIGELCKNLSDNKCDYKIKVLHVTPDQYEKYIEKDKYNIGHLFWETSRIPKEFVKACNMLQEIWTGSKTNADAIRDSGVTVPIYICPQAIETDRPDVKPYKIPGEPDDRFYFYSIFEWTERKNPSALIRAYFEEFSADENVSMIVKTYLGNFNSEQTRTIQKRIQNLKEMYSKNNARLFVYKYLMDRNQIERLHRTGRCYVSPHRGEGWGIPIVEAMVNGNPVITTDYNGVNEYLNYDTAFLLTHKMIPVRNDRSHNWYTSDQKWADIDIKDLREAMRYVYTNQAKAKAVGEQGRKFAIDNFNFKAVGDKLLSRLEKIERDLV